MTLIKLFVSRTKFVKIYLENSKFRNEKQG